MATLTCAGTSKKCCAGPLGSASGPHAVGVGVGVLGSFSMLNWARVSFHLRQTTLEPPSLLRPLFHDIGFTEWACRWVLPADTRFLAELA
jgi:hypothetical protein